MICVHLTRLCFSNSGVPIPQQLTTTLPANVPTTSPSPQPQYPGPPLNVRGQALSDTEVKVSWSPPVNPHGKVISYNVFYSPKDGPGGVYRGVQGVMSFLFTPASPFPLPPFTQLLSQWPALLYDWQDSAGFHI